MITMNQYELIRTAHRVYGKSIRKIARDYGHSRKTIRKALRGDTPNYKKQNNSSSPVMDSFLPVVGEWLKGDVSSPKKQRHTSRRIFDRLVQEHGFRGGESTVRAHVRRLKQDLGLSKIESVVPLISELGKEAEVDWGEADVWIGGQLRRVYLFCMRSRYSGKSFVRAYPNQKQEMFFDGHMECFSYFGGIFETLVYDNLTTAVKKILKGHSRIEQTSFIAFRSYYTYNARFCNPAKGNEKGGVEGLVGYARRNYLVPIPHFDHFDDLNQFLIKKCKERDESSLIREGKKRLIRELYAEENQLLLSLPQNPFSNTKSLSGKVNKYQTITVDRNHYSVPDQYTGCSLQVTLSCSKIEIHSHHRKVAEHQRLFGNGQWSLSPFHYLKALSRKPGAFDQARPIVMWRENWPACYHQMLIHLRKNRGFSDGTRQFIEILKLQQLHSEEKVQTAVQLAIDAGSYGVESVKMLLDKKWAEQLSFPSLEPDRIPGLTNLVTAKPDLSQFNQLMN